MNATTIRGVLRAALFTGAIGVIPQAALADEGYMPTGIEITQGVPDHQEAEARGVTSAESSLEMPKDVPDHQEAEAGGAGTTTISTQDPRGVPDHQEAENRGVGAEIVP